VSARWVVFAYHTIGARALAALLDRGETILAVVTHIDDPSEGHWFESVADIARAHGVPVLTPKSPNDPDVVGQLAALDADLFLSVWYRRLLGERLLALPRIASLNLHGSLLPAYRGRAPLNWVLVNGETRTGVTLHHMAPDADAGDIVAQASIDIAPDDTALTLYGRMIKRGVDLLVESYPAVVGGTARRVPQDHARATVFGRRTAEDGRVAWDWAARRITNMIRAVTHPFPGAFVGDGDRRVYLWEGSVDSLTSAKAPGTIIDIAREHGIAIATGDGVLRVTRIQSSNDNEQAAATWAHTRGLSPGDRMPGA
jgi:UDP-4-amino-4-deoxy-L-arabinose formyltransferase/UDP-glucuronic acid dehydrogenase (UDP-4-keto-hexauronic acid decarboxylating)